MNRSDHPHFNPWLALVVVCFGQFMVVLDATIVNVALPAIQNDLGFSDSSLAWVVNAYTLFFGGFLLLGGRAADLLGRRTLFIAGVVVFSLASLANGLATSETQLIIGRAIQGLGGAMLSPAALSVITTSFSEGAERTKALSVWAGVAAGGGAVGLLLGGFLVESLSWEWIFFVNVPVGIAIIFAALKLVPNSVQEGAMRHFDLAGAGTVTGGLVALVYAIVEASSWGWASGKTLGVAALGIALLVAFVFIERRSPAPLVRLELFKLRSLATGNGVFLLVAGGLFAMFYFASLYLQNVLGYSPLTTGLAFLPVTFGIAIGATIAEKLIPRVGLRPVLMTGMLVAAAGLAVLAATTEVGGHYPGVVGGLFPMSIGMGATFVSLTLVGDDQRRGAGRRASPRGSSTPRSRSAARSAWRCSPASPTRRPPTSSAGSSASRASSTSRKRWCRDSRRRSSSPRRWSPPGRWPPRCCCGARTSPGSSRATSPAAVAV